MIRQLAQYTFCMTIWTHKSLKNTELYLSGLQIHHFEWAYGVVITLNYQKYEKKHREFRPSTNIPRFEIHEARVFSICETLSQWAIIPVPFIVDFLLFFWLNSVNIGRITVIK